MPTERIQLHASAPLSDRGRALWLGTIDRLGRAGLSALGPLIFVGIWWLVVGLHLLPATILPSPVKVLHALFDWAFGDPELGPYSGTLLDATMASSQRVFAGFAFASIIAVPLGLAVGYFPVVGRIVDPLVHLLRPIPVTAWVPLSLVFWGFGFQGAVFLIALGSFFPIVVNTSEGVRGVSLSLVKVGRMLGATRMQMLRHFVFPAALPAIFVGLRLGIGLSWVLVIVAELLSVKSGIGYTLLDAYSFTRYDVIIAAMIILGTMGFLSDRILMVAQQLLLRWHQEITIHER